MPRRKTPRKIIDLSEYPKDDQGRAIVPDDFFVEHVKELPDGTGNESGTLRSYRGGILKILGKDPEHDAYVQKAGADASNAKQAQRKTFKEALDDGLRRKDPETGSSQIEKITISMILKAIDGDVKAAQFIRDTVGEQPVSKQEITADIMTPADRALIEKIERRIQD